MKKIYIILFTLFLFVDASAQWSVIYTSTVTPEELRSCFFISPSVGIAVGAQTVVGNPATIKRTTNGGLSWTDIFSVYTDTLRSVWFVNSTLGFACGAKGRIIRTIDAGLNWDTVASGVNNLLRSVTFPTAQTGYICGGGGIILKSVDSGNTWVQLVSPVTQDLINMRFLNQDTGYAASSSASFQNGYVIRTFDGGTTWNTVYTDAQGMLGIGMADANTILSGGGNQTIVRSTDGGQTWGTVYTGGAGTNFRGCWFNSSTSGYMIGDLGSIFKTTNAGASWTSVTLTSNGLLGIHFPVADTGYAVGNGIIIKYTTPCIPAAPASISGSGTACSFDTVVYCVPPVTGATSYLWNIPPGNTLLSGQGDTCISVIFGNQTSGSISCLAMNLCGQGDSVMLSVNVQIAPAAPSISLVGNQLMSSTANNIQWYLNGVLIPGATTQLYTPLQNGSYTVTYTSPVGCTATSAPFDFLTTGINNADSNQEIFIYPNPVGNELIVESSKFKVQSIGIYDMIGQAAISNQLIANSQQQVIVDVSDLITGIYFLKLTTVNGFVIKKLTKE